jgi:hypothetical protein
LLSGFLSRLSLSFSNLLGLLSGGAINRSLLTGFWRPGTGCIGCCPTRISSSLGTLLGLKPGLIGYFNPINLLWRFLGWFGCSLCGLLHIWPCSSRPYTSCINAIRHLDLLIGRIPTSPRAGTMKCLTPCGCII